MPSEDFPTIQDGIDAAAPGDTVLVAAGVYRGFGNRNLSFLGRGIVVRSESGPASTVIDVEGSAADPARGFSFMGGEPPEAVLEGFTIRNGYMSGTISADRSGLGKSRRAGPRHVLSGGGITIQSFSSPLVRNCVIESCHSDFTGGGISIESRSEAQISDCVVIGCSASVQGGGISVETQSNAWIADCSVTGNYAPRGGGLACDATAVFTGCTIAGNRASEGGGVWLSLPANLELLRTVIWGNCATMEGAEVLTELGTVASFDCCLADSSAVVSRGVLTYDDATRFEDPLFCDAPECEDAPTAQGDFSVAMSSPASAEHSGCGQTIGAFSPSCVRVPTIRTSWGSIKATFGR